MLIASYSTLSLSIYSVLVLIGPSNDSSYCLSTIVLLHFLNTLPITQSHFKFPLHYTKLPPQPSIPLLRPEFQAHTVHTMPFVRGRIETFSLEYMPQVAVALGASHLGPNHPKRLVLVDHQSTWNGIVKRRPATVGVEFRQRLVKWVVARHTLVDSRPRRSLVVLSRVGSFSAQFPENPELFGRQDRLPLLV